MTLTNGPCKSMIAKHCITKAASGRLPHRKVRRLLSDTQNRPVSDGVDFNPFFAGAILQRSVPAL